MSPGRVITDLLFHSNKGEIAFLDVRKRGFFWSGFSDTKK
jgi:hypothetical protein